MDIFTFQGFLIIIFFILYGTSVFGKPGKIVVRHKVWVTSCVLFYNNVYAIFLFQTRKIHDNHFRYGFKMSNAKNTTRRPEMSAIPGSKVMACQDTSCLPKSFTWLTAKDRCPSLVQIRNQSCGSCWAVAAAAVISDRHCLQTQENRIFSAKEITICAINDGCHGGDPKEAMDYYVNHGVVSGGDPTVRGQREGCLPNQNIKDDQTKCDSCEKCEQKCDLTYDVPFTEDKRKGIHSYTITSKDVNEIKIDLMMYGPLVARIDVFEDLKNYSEGIYRRTSDKKITGHAVRIIGWGEEDGLPHWICANSWGANWGENGFFRMPLGHNECNVEEYLVGVEVDNKAYIDDQTHDSKLAHVSPTSGQYRTPVLGPPEKPTVEPAQNTLYQKLCKDASCLPPSFSWLDQKDRCPSLECIEKAVCGSYWAQTTADVISDRYCLRTNEKRTFSSKQLATCVIPHSKTCTVFYPIQGMNYYIKHGLVTGGGDTEGSTGCQPFSFDDLPNNRVAVTTCESTCQSNYNHSYNEDIRKGSRSYTITSTNITEIKLDLLNNGPLVAEFNQYPDFYYYTHGIYKKSDSIKDGYGTGYVRILGWGEEKGEPYWLFAHTLGYDWGENGFGRFLLGVNHCGIESHLTGVI